MTADLRTEPTLVPLEDGKDVEITPGQPWPSTYRGSRYSLTEARRDGRGTVVKWQYHDLDAHLHPPEGLLDGMQSVGKSGGEGRGSFRITADSEVLTKTHADNYPAVTQAPVSDGWIPVYLGRLDGELGFNNIENNPDSLHGAEIKVWEGLPFNHGERWAIGGRGNLIWKWQGYRFESAFRHNELVSRYQKFRRPPGRLYLNEHGHVFVNVDPEDIPPGTEEAVLSMYEDWRQTAQQQGNRTALRLVDRRLRATSPTDNPDDGLLPMYIGHLGEFDDGIIPKPVVDDAGYYVACGKEEDNNSW